MDSRSVVMVWVDCVCVWWGMGGGFDTLMIQTQRFYSLIGYLLSNTITLYNPGLVILLWWLVSVQTACMNSLTMGLYHQATFLHCVLTAFPTIVSSFLENTSGKTNSAIPRAGNAVSPDFQTVLSMHSGFI